MKKIYPALCAALLSVTGMAQSKTQVPLSQRIKPSLEPAGQPNFQRGGGGALWTDDFSDPSTWVLGFDAPAPPLLWQIGVGLQNTGSFPIATIESTTSANGYAMLDSDAFGNESLIESSHMTTAGPIDLSGNPNVVLEFESFYRKWTYEECYIVISTNNTDWPTLTPDTDISSMANVFHVWPDMEVQAVLSNPTLVRINISAAAGGQSEVWVRFHWTGTYGYSWFVDDVAIREQPANDMVLDYGFLSHTGLGEEYGRIPSTQLNSQILVGGSLLNFGYEDQTNIELMMEVRNSSNTVVFDHTFTVGGLTTGVTEDVEEFISLPSLPNDLYTATFTLTSAEEFDGPDFGNNTFLRSFEIIDELYSLDGIGNHPAGYEVVGSIGTNSFIDGASADGFMMLVYYELIAPLTVYGIEMLIDNATQVDAAVVVNLHNAADILAEPSDVGLPIVSSDIQGVSQADIDAGVVRVAFSQPFDLAPGQYYAGVEMFSNGNANDIRILNDLTVPQPATASMIYLSGDDVFTNGNAAAIRLLMDPSISIQERDGLEGISMFPNPTNGLLYIHAEDADAHSVEVMNALGELVHTTRVNGSGVIDLGHLAQGVYAVRVSKGAAEMVQRVVLH